MKNLHTFFFVFISFWAFAQGPQSVKPLDLVRARQERTVSFEKVSPFQAVTQKKSQLTELDKNAAFDVLDVNLTSLQKLIADAPEQLTLTVPYPAKGIQFELDLVQVDLFTPDFQVTMASTGQAATIDHGIHYRGIVKGDEKSIVAISICGEEVMGLIAIDGANLVLGKLRGSQWNNEHVIYNDKEILSDQPFECGTLDDGIGYKPGYLQPTPNRNPGDCIRLYMEVDHDIYVDKGGAVPTTNFVTGLMNEVITMYANESISAVVSEIFLWDVTSPYSSTTSTGMLSDFQSYRNGFNGDLAQLLSYQASGGIAAGFSGICNGNPDLSMSFASIDPTYLQVPTYSWSVMVCTHEFGHLWGSRHTHACVWNGNNTAIDGCAGSTEGTCPLPGYPSEGGTIMSYCHLQSVGINFNLGFGPQPGNVIRNTVNFSPCTQPCGAPSYSCDDGIQNGLETGVDCGGPSCPPCPCTGQDVTLTIVLDNYPSETTWTVTKDGLTYALGGPYSSPGSTVIETFCLNDDCYDFTIFDAYGDGICCSFGSGSYSLEDAAGNILASGGAFGLSETTNFCLNNNCTPATSEFPSNPLTHSGSGSSSTSVVLGGVHTNVSFTISGLNAVTGGKPQNRYTEQVTVTYEDENGNLQTYGTFNTPQAPVSSVDVNLPGQVTVVSVSLTNGNGGAPPVQLSVNFSTINSCGDSTGGCPDSDGDGICDADDPCNAIESDPLIPNPLTHSGGGSSSAVLDYGNTAHQEVAFTISGLDAKTNGNPNKTYIEIVTVEYDNGTSTQLYGTYSGQDQSTVNVEILNEDVYSVTVTLSDGVPNPSQNLSVNFSPASSCIPTGSLPEMLLEDETFELAAKLFPNPVTNQLMVQVELPGVSDAQMRITDINGTLVRLQELEPAKGFQSVRVDVSQLPPGMYLLHLSADGQRVVEKFVIIR
ncbi:MAG: T9SS type A sorting domain-containing protein [Lewinellaceae bacterium]|nr:T9SS type A sorting domain-containing protein [Lewinellaceae bacterium]